MSKGKLTVVAGPMFSGKTGKLVAIVEVLTRMGQTVLTVKPDIDNRFGDDAEIHSHDHKKTPAMVASTQNPEQAVSEILATKANTVIFDEVQFFNPEKIVMAINELRDQGINVIAAGLLYDFKRSPFGATSNLIGLADESLELMSICQKCGGLARHSQRVAGSQSQIDVGEADKYIAACERCHVIYQ